MSALDDVTRTEFAGLPAYVADVPGPARGALVFRVGQADEPLPRRGLVHLAEHLALGGYGPADRIMGEVGLLITIAAAEGTPGEVAQRLQHFARALGDPPAERIETECRILAVEGGGTRPPSAALLWQWYGARGPGVTAWPEYGARHAQPEDVAETAAAWFTRGNVAVLLTKPIPDPGSLALPAGERRSVPDLRVVAHAPLPAETHPYCGERTALGAPLPTGPATRVLAALLQRRSWAALRQDRGMAYRVAAIATPCTRDETLVYVTSDVDDDDAGPATSAVLAEIRRIADGDFSDGDLATAKADIVRRAELEPLWVLAGAAIRELTRDVIRMPGETLAAVEQVPRDEVAGLAGELRDRLIAVLPPGAASGELPQLETGGEPVRGTRYRNLGADEFDLVVGHEGVSFGSVEHAFTVRYDECVAAVRGDGDALLLFGQSPVVVPVDPAEHAHGREALARVERALPATVFVPVEGERPEDDAAARERRQRLHARPGTASSGATVRWTRLPND